MRDHAGTNKFQINAGRFANAYPSIINKYGADEELDMELSLHRPRVIFGPETGENVHFQTTIKFGLKELGSMNYIVYDEIMLETTFNFEISEETILANFMTMNVSRAGQPENRTKPIYSEDDFSEGDYDEFWSFANMKTQNWFEYFNNEIFG